ncbi:hypothetical protein [Streptomyces sp. GQFP]|uniref:hypothetical protein n=1 Tax=Streptomyces sp. GQFP TaxID=2907545 RepID=UPI001F40D171|nr:hypothetical protein [Streptomyces sp. GQFP]UIX30088.1 hypothetical protein LUX31_08605 [Streptomyces sp. GQFP]
MNDTVIDTVIADDPVIVCLDTTGENGENWRECADVLFSTRPRPAAEAWLLAGLVLWRYPGCSLVLLAGVGGGCVARARVGVGGTPVLRTHAGVTAAVATGPPDDVRRLG